MKTALWILGSLLVADVLYAIGGPILQFKAVGYEGALVMWFFALLVGLPVLGAFIAVLAVQQVRRRNSAARLPYPKILKLLGVAVVVTSLICIAFSNYASEAIIKGLLWSLPSAGAFVAVAVFWKWSSNSMQSGR